MVWSFGLKDEKLPAAELRFLNALKRQREKSSLGLEV